MACFFIDYENQSGRLLEGISLLDLNVDDEIILFYTKSSKHITMQLHCELERLPAKKVYILAESGTANALDFQLVTYLGACIQKYPDKTYYIVSKDSGFDCVCSFWRKNNISVNRIERLFYYLTLAKQE